MILDIIASVLSVTGVILNARKIVFCWYLWIINDLIWIGYSIAEGRVFFLIMWIVFLITNLYALYEWKNNGK